MDWLDFFDLLGALACSAALIALGAWLGTAPLRKQLRRISHNSEASAVLLGSVNHKLEALLDNVCELGVDVELIATHAADIRATVDQLHNGGRKRIV